MERKIKDLLRNISSPDMEEKAQQEMLSLFHIDNLEFTVKAELTEILDNIDVTEEEKKKLNPLFEKIWRMINEKRDREKKSFRLLYPLMKVAAALLIGLVIGRLIITAPGETQLSYYTSKAPKGSVSQIILPDSTLIYLNSGSTLKYATGKKDGQREVFLDGEAWFQVQKSKDRPFIVHTVIYDVSVKGTEFNVKAYYEDDNVITTLEKGEVIISSTSKGFEESILLKPGEQLVYNKVNGSMIVMEVEPLWFNSWKENKLIFVNMSLKELVVLLERKYGVDIQIVDPEILKYHYDGTIKNESIIEVLNLLELTLPVEYKINDQKIEISRKKIK